MSPAAVCNHNFIAIAHPDQTSSSTSTSTFTPTDPTTTTTTTTATTTTTNTALAVAAARPARPADLASATASSLPRHHPAVLVQPQPAQIPVPSGPAVGAPTARPPTPTKRRSHPRLSSIGGFLRSRAVPGGDHHQQHRAPALPNGNAVRKQVASTPSASSSPVISDASTLSNQSSVTTLSDDSKSLYGRHHRLAKPNHHNHRLSPTASSDSDDLADSAHDHADRNPQQPRVAKPPTMHQTSSRLLRMTEDERPFTRDFNDLFATLVVSLPLTPHRVRFSRIEHTFTTEEAITNLGNLRFSQSNRMPDPKEPSRIVTTTTTTTFSMAKEMARSVCMRFLEARFIESVEGRTDFNSRSSVWQLRPKGMHILFRFCQRNGIHQRHVNELLDSPRNIMQLVILEREADTDKINRDQATVNVIFKRFAGDSGPNLKSNSTASDTESVSDYATGLVGVRMQRARRTDRDAPYSFTGKAAFDWLMDCCTTVDKREVFEIANYFLQFGLMEPTTEDKQNTGPVRFAASKHTSYAVTRRGMRVAGWITGPNGAVNGEATVAQRAPAGVARDSNTNRMTVIIRDPALRLLFREYLRETHCEENLAFYIEVKTFLADYDRAKREASPPKMDVIRETLASAYSLYNAFLAPGSPCELNIDHSLRNALAGRMTRAVGEDDQMLRSLDEIATLFDQAQSSVFKLMASDSVPKFSREPKYANIVKERNLESMLANVSVS